MSPSVKTPASRDPNIALLVSVVGLFVAAPALGYVYLNDMRKAAIYILGFWLMLAIAAALTFLWNFISNEMLKAAYGAVAGLAAYPVPSLCGVCGWPLVLPVFAMVFIITYDVYATARGEPSRLPEF